MKDITAEDAEKYGIQNKHSILDNGEKRFRQYCSKDNTAYIRAEGLENGYWQRSHFHKSIREIYIVQKGPILLAQYINNKVKIQKFNESGIFIIEPNIPHNIYMYPHAVLHTVKYGKVEEYDWVSFDLLDEKIKEMPKSKLERYLKKDANKSTVKSVKRIIK